MRDEAAQSKKVQKATGIAPVDLSQTVLFPVSALEVLEVLSSGALVVDFQGRILYANPEFQRMRGAVESAWQGQSIETLFKLPVKSDCAICRGAYTPESSMSALVHGAFLRVDRLNGKPEEVRVKVKHSPYGDRAMLCLIDLFSEDAILTQAHSDFVSTVSHEFRTPLTSIKGFADTLLSYGDQLPEDEKRRFVSIIKDQADRLIRLVENLLTASRLGAGRVEMMYRPMNVAKLFDKVTRSIEAKFQAKSVKVPTFQVSVTPDDMEVWADADRLEQILLNLVDNAVKYSPPGSVVRLKGEFLPEDASKVRMVVQDEGAGIPAELLPQIFTKFYRVESPLKQEVEGTGLGLYITQSLTNAMGGTIAAESTPGQGSRFTVVFAAATPERQAAYRRQLYADQGDEA